MSRPKNKEMSRQKTREEEYQDTFKIGTAVEVSSEDQGLRGSWYTATVIRTPSRTNSNFLLQYHNLFTDDSGSTPLREHVKPVLIRPIPPVQLNPVFNNMDDVDAYHNDGWWEGVVTDVMQDSRYSVFFRCSREQINFSASDLRLHREWITANQWVPPLDTPSSSSSTPTGQKRKNGEDGDDGGRSPGENGRKTRKVEIRNAGRVNITSPSKQGRGGGDGGTVMRNGGGREATRSSNRNPSVVSGRNHSVLSNGVRSKSGVTRNGTLKEPRRRGTSHTGGTASRK